MYMPVPAMSQAITAPSGPVALAKVRGSEKIPAPTMPPTTIAVKPQRDIFCSVAIVSPKIIDCFSDPVYTIRMQLRLVLFVQRQKSVRILIQASVEL